jgi:hypothetical protein
MLAASPLVACLACLACLACFACSCGRHINFAICRPLSVGYNFDPRVRESGKSDPMPWIVVIKVREMGLLDLHIEPMSS